MKRANNLSWGLFNFRGRYFWRNIKDIPIFIERIFFTLKHGYTPQAQWETFDWFIDTMREVLAWHRHYRMGTGYILDEPPELDNDEQFKRNIKVYNDELDRMLELLNQMEENNEMYDNLEPDDWKKTYEMQEGAKDEFCSFFDCLRYKRFKRKVEKNKEQQRAIQSQQKLIDEMKKVIAEEERKNQQWTQDKLHSNREWRQNKLKSNNDY